eukprot:919118-Pelagomonas_calceolata.AAC.6
MESAGAHCCINTHASKTKNIELAGAHSCCSAYAIKTRGTKLAEAHSSCSIHVSGKREGIGRRTAVAAPMQARLEVWNPPELAAVAAPMQAKQEAYNSKTVSAVFVQERKS